jgi:aryl-alcohol dehydrogenase-like predicted oxidoreductase
VTSRIIGNWLKKTKKRDSLIIADKVTGRSGMNWIRPGETETRLNKKQINIAIDNSLKNLQTDHVDIYQLHWPDRPLNIFSGLEYEHTETADIVPILETMETMASLIKAGKIKYYGLSNETPWGTSQYLKLAEKHNIPKPITIQNAYSLINRSYEVGLAEISIREKIGLLAYSPLGGGHLSGKYLGGKKPAGTREVLWGNRFDRYRTPNTQPAVQAYYDVAKKHNLNLAQMAIQFCTIQKFVTSTIIGATSMEQLKKDIDSIDLVLTNEIIKDINNVQLIYSNPCP